MEGASHVTTRSARRSHRDSVPWAAATSTPLCSVASRSSGARVRLILAESPFESRDAKRLRHCGALLHNDAAQLANNPNIDIVVEAIRRCWPRHRDSQRARARRRCCARQQARAGPLTRRSLSAAHGGGQAVLRGLGRGGGSHRAGAARFTRREEVPPFRGCSTAPARTCSRGSSKVIPLLGPSRTLAVWESAKRTHAGPGAPTLPTSSRSCARWRGVSRSRSIRLLSRDRPGDRAGRAACGGAQYAR